MNDFNRQGEKELLFQDTHFQIFLIDVNTDRMQYFTRYLVNKIRILIGLLITLRDTEKFRSAKLSLFQKWI